MFYYVITDKEQNILFSSEDMEIIDKKKEEYIKDNKKIEIYCANEIFDTCELIYSN